jgi:tetratricopeptide (TPR) repeat protein
MIFVQLIDAKKDKHIWSKQFKKEFNNIFALESEIATQIATELKITLSPLEIQQIEAKPTDNMEAYTLYLNGRFFWLQKTKKDLERSIFYYNQALQLDSTYALAYSGLADTYLHMAGWGWYNRLKGLSKAKEYAKKALSINNNIAESHATMGALLAYGQWKWHEGEIEFKQAIALKPNYDTAHEYYSMLLDVEGRHAEARREIDIALQLNPHSITINQLSAIYYFRSEDYEKALEKNIKNQKDFKNHPLETTNNIRIYIMQKKYAKAINELKHKLESEPSTQKFADTIQLIYKNSGINGVYRWEIQNDIENKANIYFIAQKYAFLGENDKALNLLESCYKKRSIWAPYIKCNPFFKNLRSEPRFQTILDEMNLAD